MPETPDALFRRLDDLGIAHHTVTHPAVFTVAESQALRGTLPGGHSKNLFLRDKKGRMWLVVALEDRAIDLKALRRVLGAGPLSFGSAERLLATLGIEPGSVTPFSLVNDAERLVTPVLDAGLMAHDPLHFHPLINTMTTAIAPGDLLRFMRALGYEPTILDLGALPPPT